VNVYRLNPNHTGWYSIYVPWRDERLSWPWWLVIYRDGLPVRRVTYPDSNHLIATRLAVEPRPLDRKSNVTVTLPSHRLRIVWNVLCRCVAVQDTRRPEADTSSWPPSNDGDFYPYVFPYLHPAAITLQVSNNCSEGKFTYITALQPKGWIAKIDNTEIILYDAIQSQ